VRWACNNDVFAYDGSTMDPLKGMSPSPCTFPHFFPTELSSLDQQNPNPNLRHLAGGSLGDVVKILGISWERMQ
jgi:hypothetical protein